MKPWLLAYCEVKTYIVDRHHSSNTRSDKGHSTCEYFLLFRVIRGAVCSSYAHLKNLSRIISVISSTKGTEVVKHDKNSSCRSVVTVGIFMSGRGVKGCASSGTVPTEPLVV